MTLEFYYFWLDFDMPNNYDVLLFIVTVHVSWPLVTIAPSH